MANPKQAAAVTDSVNISDGQSIGWGAAVEAAIDTKAAELEAAERSESYQPAKPKPLPKTHASVGPTNFPSKKPEVKEEVKPIETVDADPVKKSAAAVEPVEPPAPADQPKPLPIDAWVSAGMRAALSAAQQRGSRPLTQDEAIAAANSRIDAMAKSEGKTIDDYSSEAKRRGISLQTLINESAKEINNQWALSQTSARQSAAMSGVQAPAGPAPVKFDVASAEKAIKDKLYGEAKARGVDINATQPKILTATELRAEAVFKMSGQKSGFMGNPETSQDAEVSKPGEVGAQTAELTVTELFSRDSDGTLGAYIQSLQNNPGGYEEWVKTESEKLLKQRGVRPGDPNFTEQQRLTRAQAANEVFAMKTIGLWTAPIFTNRDLQPDSYWDALGPSIEVVGYGNEVVNGKPVVIQRQESWGSWFLNALDAPQYALVGVWDAAGKPNAPGESTADNVWKSVKSATAGRRFIFKAVTESESFQPRQVYNADGSLALNEKGEPLTTENWRPWVFGTVGFAASVFMPDAGTMLIFPTAAKIAKGFSTISESKRAEKGAEILTQIAASRTAAKAQFEESLALADEAAKATDPVTKAEKSAASLEARRQADSLFEAASAQERKLFAEQEGLAKHLDDTDGDAHKQMTSQASIDSANVHLARTIVDRADALETLHPSLRKPFKSIEGKASKMIPVGRKDLYDTHSQLKRAEDSFKNAKRLPETRAAVLSFISQPELDQLKSVLSETDYKEVLDQLPNAINNPNGFMQFMMTKRLNVQYPSGVTAASPAGHAWRQKVVAPGASIVRKAKNIDANVAAVERRVYDAILNNSESRAVAADTLANVLRKEGPRNIPSIDKIPDLGDPALKMAEGDVNAAVDMTNGAKKLVAQLRSAGLNKKQSIAIAALMDTRARTWAWKTGNSAEDWYKIGNADRISFVKEQVANVPMLQRGTSEFLFEIEKESGWKNGVSAVELMKENATAIDAAKFVAENAKDKALSAIAQNLIGSLHPSEKLVIVDEAFQVGEIQAEGARKLARRVFDKFDPGIVTVTKGSAPDLIVHELIHAATANQLHRYEMIMAGDASVTLSNEALLAARELDQIFNYAKRQLSEVGQYGFTDLHEFVAEVMSNSEFQELLHKLPGVLNKGSSVLQEITKRIMSLLHIKPSESSAFIEALDAVNRLSKTATDEISKLEKVNVDIANSELSKSSRSTEISRIDNQILAIHKNLKAIEDEIAALNSKLASASIIDFKRKSDIRKQLYLLNAERINKISDYRRVLEEKLKALERHSAETLIERHVLLSPAKNSQSSTIGAQTPEFKRWFGKSKAVDKSGNPRVAYHATDRAFGEFKPGLTYTTFSKSAASEYGDRVIPVFVKAERPKMMYDEDWRLLLDDPRTVERLRAKGYDSAISDDTGDIVVFDSSSLRPVNGPKSMLAAEPTTTPEFKRWFNGSKVTDRSGRPLVVYHATDQSILAFNPLAYDKGRPTSLGSHFGDERTVKHITDESEEAGVENLNVMPVYLSVKNPLRIPDYDNTAVGILETLASAKPANTELFAAAKKIFSTPIGKQLMDSLNAGEFEKHVVTADPDLNGFIPEPPSLKNRVRLALEQAGYDGLVYKNRFEKTFDQGHVDSWAVLRPEQVKSVFNRGTFNPEDPRILFRKTAVDKAEAQLIVAIENVKDYRAHSVPMPVGPSIPLRSALSSIAESDPRDHVKLIAKRLSESVTVDSSTVNIISGPNEDIAKLILAKAANENDYLIKYARENGEDLNYAHNASGLAYSSGPKTGRIEIKLPEVSGTANVPNLIVLHEATHIATSRYIAPMLALPVEEARKLPAEVKQATDKLRDTFKKVSQHIKDGNDEVAKVQYGLMNVHEFVAEAVANPHFQNILKSITLTNERKTVWSYFVETVAGLLGITHKLKGDALTETLAAFDKILTATSGPSFIKAAGATEDIERMENRLIELERAVAQKPHLGLSHNDEIRSLRKWIASAKRDAAKAAKVTAEPAKVIKPAPIPTGDVSTAKAHLAAMRKAEDDAKAIYADALAAKRANPKDKALKEAVDAARQKLAKAMSDTTDAERAAKVEIRAETKAQQAAELEDPDIKQAYARVRAAERKVNETNDAIEKSKLALADAVRNKNGPARRAAEREIATLEAALGTFEKSYNETRNVYKRLSDEFKARKAAEKAAEAVKAETAVKESTTAKAATETVADPEGTAIIQRPATEPVKSTGGLPVGTRSSNPEEEFIDLDETGTATQVTPPAQTSTHITPSTGTVNPPTPPVPPPPAIPPAIPPAPPALPKGAVAFYNDGRAIVYAFEKADINTFVHEIGHVVRRDLLDDEREALKVWLSAESGKSVEIDDLGNFVDSTTGTLFSKADSDALDELFTNRFVDWMATSAKAPIKEGSSVIHKVFESIKGWMIDAFNALKATLPNAVSPEIDGFFTDIMSVSKDPTAVSSAFSAAKRVVEKKRGFIRGMIGPDAGSVELYVFDELAKGAKAGGLNVTPAQLENMLETRGTIEFPRPILGKTKYDANDIAALQKDLEEIGTTELYRSKAKLTASDLAKSVTEESTTDKLWNMLRDEPLNYDTIADPTKPRNPIAAFAKSIARAGVALYIGLDEMADLRHLPPAVRQTILSGVRVINSVYHDALKIAEERDSAKLIDYLTGKNVRFYNGRRVMTASWDSVSSVQMRLKNIIEACGPAMVADLHNLTHTPDFSNLNPAQSASVARAAEFVLNTTNSMYVKQLLQVLGASQPANKAYDAINTPKELILAKALVNFAYAAPTSGVTRFRDITGKLYGESSSVKALVLMAAHGQADRVRKTWFNAGIAVSSTDAALFKSWINAEYVPDSAMPAIKRVADTLGLNPTFVPALDAIGKYEVPAAAYDRLTSALAKANPEKQHWLMKSESDTAGSSGPMAALQAWVRWRKSSMVRGSLLVRSRLLTSNSMDLILMVGNNLGLGVAAAAAGRVAAQTTLALAPGVTRAIDVASRMGWANPKALENVRDAIQKGGDKFAGYLAKTMWDKAVSLDVNSLLSGEKKVFNMGGKVYSWSDLRQIALEEGVFDSLPASIESAVRRGVRPPSTTLEKVGDKFASYSEYVSDVQEGVSERERAGLMLTLMELGVNPRIAARLTVNTMFDYITTVASQERSLLLSLFEPFWPFIKNAGRSLVNNFFSGYGAHRIGLLRRATERSFDAINELVYDSITDPYGVDVSALSDEGRDNYFEMRRVIESKYGGIEKVPLNVKLSIGSVFAGQTSYFLHDGKIYALKSRVGEIAAGTNNNNKLSPYVERLGLPARLDIEDAVIPRPDRSGSSSFYRDLYAMTIPMTLTKQTQRYMELAAPDHPFIEFLMPETYVQTSVRRMGGLTALAVLGAYGLWDSASGLISGAGPTDGEMEGLNWTRAGNITEQVLDPERSMLLPQAYGLLFDEDNSRPYRIHPILAKALDTIGVSHLSVNAAQDPFAVTFDTAAPTPTDVNASSESVNKNLLPGEASPDLGAGVTTTRHYLPAHWGVIIQSIPDLDGLNRELLRYNDAADLKPGSGPMERSADPLYPILSSAYRVITGLSTAEPHRSKNALREEPRRDTKTTNPVK